MNLLEMFSGTGSVGTVAKSLGYIVISLDLKNADINCDILEWDYKQFDRNHFNFIWVSPLALGTFCHLSPVFEEIVPCLGDVLSFVPLPWGRFVICPLALGTFCHLPPVFGDVLPFVPCVWGRFAICPLCLGKLPPALGTFVQ